MRTTDCRALVMLACLAVPACSSGAPKPAEGGAAGAPTSGLASEEDKTAYAAGFLLGRNLAPLGLSGAELEAAMKGIRDAAGAKPAAVALETYGPRIQPLIQQRSAKRAEGEKAKSQAFLDTAAKEEGTTRTSSGLVFKTLASGQGPSPQAASTVKVHYRGTLTDGTEFDSSIKRGQPAEFRLDQVIPCWTEGVQRMKVGEKARLVCPSSIAYGDQGSPPTIPGGATLVFEVELLEVRK